MAKKQPQTDLGFLFNLEEFSKEFDNFFLDFPDDIPAHAENYLLREDRLLTLAREKFQHLVGNIELTEAEERLYSYVPAEDDRMGDILQYVARSVAKPLLKSMVSMDDKYATMLLSLVESSGIDIRFVNPEDIPDTIKRRLKVYLKNCCDGDEVIGVAIREEGFAPLTVYGLKTSANPNKGFIFRDGVVCAEMPYLFSSLIIYAQVENMLSAYRLGKREQDDLFISLCGIQDGFRTTFVKNRISFHSVDGNCLDSFESFLQVPLLQSKLAYGNEYMEGIVSRRYRRITNINHSSKDTVRDDEVIKKYAVLRNSYYESELILNFAIEERVPFHALIAQTANGDPVPIFAGVSKKARRYREYDALSFWASLFRKVAQEKNDYQSSVSYYRELDSTYAKSFMTKANINGKYQKAMEASLFNKFFGFVEFDEDTNLQNVEEIAKEFQCVKDTYLQNVYSGDASIRFRKLGQHNATGLYYPSFGCLCVDIHSPQSLIHEYGHLIDYTYGILSCKTAFSVIRSMYRDMLLKAINLDNSLRSQMEGKTKYNLSYYLKPTEVFARCFELYISKCLGVCILLSLKTSLPVFILCRRTSCN